MTSEDLWNITMKTNIVEDYFCKRQRLALLKYRWKNLAKYTWYSDVRVPKEISLETRVAINALRKVTMTSFQCTISNDTTYEKVRKSSIETVCAPLAENAVSIRNMRKIVAKFGKKGKRIYLHT